MSGRSLHAKAILGEELFSRLSSTKVLLVGAGGIGCELRMYHTITVLKKRRCKIVLIRVVCCRAALPQ